MWRGGGRGAAEYSSRGAGGRGLFTFFGRLAAGGIPPHLHSAHLCASSRPPLGGLMRRAQSLAARGGCNSAARRPAGRAPCGRSAAAQPLAVCAALLANFSSALFRRISRPSAKTSPQTRPLCPGSPPSAPPCPPPPRKSAQKPALASACAPTRALAKRHTGLPAAVF